MFMSIRASEGLIAELSLETVRLTRELREKDKEMKEIEHRLKNGRVSDTKVNAQPQFFTCAVSIRNQQKGTEQYSSWDLLLHIPMSQWSLSLQLICLMRTVRS